MTMIVFLCFWCLFGLVLSLVGVLAGDVEGTIHLICISIEKALGSWCNYDYLRYLSYFPLSRVPLHLVIDR